MHVAHSNTLFVHVFGQVFGHALGQRRDQHAVALGCNLADLVQQIVHLRFDRADFNRRIEQSGGPDHLFGENAAGLFQLPFLRRGGYEDRLRPHRVPLLEFQRPVVGAGRQAEAVFGQRELAAIVAPVHAAYLRHRHVAFVGEYDGVVGNVFEQGRGRLARCATRQVSGIVLDPVADTSRLQHFEVELGALFQTLGLQQLALGLKLFQADGELLFDAFDSLLHRRARRDVV